MTTIAWERLRSDLFAKTGTVAASRSLNSYTLGPISIPTASGFTAIAKSEYAKSPRPKSIPRRLINTFLNRVKGTGLFSTGRWIDVGGTSEYLDWLGVQPDRRDILNLPGVPTTTLDGDFNKPETLMGLGPYNGLLCLNCLLMARDPREALAAIMNLLEPGAPFVLGFNSPHFWYHGPDGEHWTSYNPFNIFALLQPHSENFVIFPLGNLVHGCLEHYADTATARRLHLSPPLRRLAMSAGKWDRSGTTSMVYIAIGLKK